MRILLTLFLVLLVTGTAAAQGNSQAALVQALTKGVALEHVLTEVESIGPKRVDAELRGALIARLEQLNQQVADAIKIDQTVDTFIAPETLAQLSRLVADFRDPRAVAALSRATYGGPAAVRALVAFGEQTALPTVMKVAMAPSSHYTEVEHVLTTMRVLVEQGKVSPAGRAQIQAAAKARLTGDQYFTIVWHAIDLAGVLKDPELNAILNDLATDPNESVRRGIVNDEVPDLIVRTQKRAADRLAGEPPLPRAADIMTERRPEP